jgi:DNA-binding NarL/FixJ family response regulator
MADRLSNREIAAALCLEIGTVKNHVHSVLRKLGLQNRQQAVYFKSRQAVAALRTVVAARP